MVTPHNLTKTYSYLLVDFAYGATTTRYTNWSSGDVEDADSNAYESVVSMEVKLPAFTGLLDDKVCTIELPSNTFTDALSQGEPHAPVDITIRGVSAGFDAPLDAQTGADAYQEDYLFRGRLSRAYRNINGRTDSVRLEAVGLKGRLRVPLGMAATPKCRLPFASTPCGVDPAPFEQTVTCEAIEGVKITVGPAFSDEGDRAYHRGYVSRNGLHIAIRNYNAAVAVDVIYLAKQPPAEWLNEDVVVHPGCGKTLTECQFWANEEHFDGTGVKIPNFNPHFESPGR